MKYIIEIGNEDFILIFENEIEALKQATELAKHYTKVTIWERPNGTW